MRQERTMVTTILKRSIYPSIRRAERKEVEEVDAESVTHRHRHSEFVRPPQRKLYKRKKVELKKMKKLKYKKKVNIKFYNSNINQI